MALARMIESPNQPERLIGLTSADVLQEIALAGIVPTRHLGTGGNAEVYLAPVRLSQCAIKVSKNPGEDNQLKQELKALKACQSPYVLKVKGEFELEGRVAALVLEYSAFGSLFSCVATYPKNPPAPHDYLQLCAQFASALAYVHQIGYVHRDVKPENVLVSALYKNPLLRLSDFGLAVNESDALQCKVVVGTREYLGPEWFQAPLKPSGKKGDVYGAGFVLAILSTWRLPFQDGSLDDLLERKRQGFRFNLNSVRINQVENMIQTCVQVDPNKRPTMSDVVKCFGLFSNVAQNQCGGRVESPSQDIENKPQEALTARK